MSFGVVAAVLERAVVLMMIRYSEAARLNAKLQRYDAAVEYSTLALAIDRDCLGTDHALYHDDVRALKELQEARARCAQTSG